MWKIREIKHENSLLDHIHLYSNRMSCKIYPNLGGSLQELKIDHIDFIDGISPSEEGLEDYRNMFKSSILFPFPNRIKDGAYEYGESSYQLDKNDETYNNAIHGLVYNKSFTFNKELSNPEKAVLILTYHSKGENKGYPFPYVLSLSYEFSNSGEVSLSFELKNTGYQSIPFGFGWHPYFRAENLDTSTLSFPAKDHFLCPERMIPEEKEEAGIESSFQLGTIRFDDGYSLDEPRCSFETENYLLTMTFDNGSESYLQVYTPEDRKSIAIEPMTCVTNAFNNEIGLEVLDPGKDYRWSIHMQLKVKS